MVDALVSIALEKLTDIVGQELSLFVGATHELKKLSSTFQSIQAVLADAESRQVGDQSVKLWLSRLRHATYDIQDLLEEGQISDLGDEEGHEDDGNSRNKVCLCFPFAYNRSASRYKVAHDIKEIRKRLDQIADDKNKYGFSSSTQDGDQRKLVRSRPLTTSLMDKSEMMIGRENDKEMMISRLVSSSSSSHEEDGRQVHLVAIAGIGGQGKTTLARQIYHDGRVRDHFNIALYWVCVSDVFDEIRLTKAILEQVKKESTSLLELDALQKELLEALEGKRFLLVLDDVWNDDVEKWNMLRLPLTGGAQGSRILVTTRGQKVAKIMNATYTHELKGLSDDDSWELFRSRAFVGRTPEEYSKLENVGREIVKKCRGVPLVITVMGSTMNLKRTMADWQNILASEMWALLEAENKILPALWLSYYNLPPQLKPCFAYCSMFPKDMVLKKDMLVRLWMAQGFIQSEGNRDIEDIGVDYFDDLVARSMFQEVEKKSQGEITCKMHDLLHDLAKFIAEDETYTFIEKSEQCPIASSNVRHSFLFFTDSTDDKFNKIPIALDRATKLRTLFLHRLHRINKFIVDIFHEARFVRALVFNDCESRMANLSSAIVKLPNAIGDLKHLRYLDLSRLDIVELPESVSDLRNLHTLNLNYCRELKKLPRGMGGIFGLRHLEIEGTYSLEYLPKGLGRIGGLRSLCKFIVGGGDEQGGCGIDELQALNSLQGTLQIKHLERVSSQEEAKKAQLWKKQCLCGLVMSEDTEDDETRTIDSVLEDLRPYENLEELKLDLLAGSKLPSWIDRMQRLQKLMLFSGPKLERVPHLPRLKEFRIFRLRNEILPDEGWEQLVELRKLIIYYCEELKCLPEGLMQLPSLENLEISYCDKLESLPAGAGLGQLKILTIEELNALRCLPDSVAHLESLESLEIRSCRKLMSLPGWLGQLKALGRLEIRNCGALTILPQELRHLSLLQELNIRGCLALSVRCKVEGMYWPNISHIPNICVDGEWIQGRCNPR